MKLPMFFRKEKWLLVKTVTINNVVYAAGEKDEKTGGKIYIHFYESNKGNRKVESACSFIEVTQSQIDAYVKSTDEYQTKVCRWLSGRYDPEIPRYSDIPEEDTANALRGSAQ